MDRLEEIRSKLNDINVGSLHITDGLFLVAEADRLRTEVERLQDTQIKPLADYILMRVPGEPSESQGACHAAMRIMDRQQEALRRVVEALDNICKFYCDWYDGKDHKSAGADMIAYDMKCLVAEALAFAKGVMGE